jgi:predicted nucleic acid-binding protein
VIICDTGPLVAAALSNDADHMACVRLFTDLHADGQDLLVPATVVAEVGYLLAREASAQVESLFLQSLAGGDFSAVDLTTPPTTHGWPSLSPRTATCRWALRTHL